MMAIKQVRRRGSFMPASIGRPPSPIRAVRVNLARHSHVVHLTATTPKQSNSRTAPPETKSIRVGSVDDWPGALLQAPRLPWMDTHPARSNRRGYGAHGKRGHILLTARRRQTNALLGKARRECSIIGSRGRNVPIENVTMRFPRTV